MVQKMKRLREYSQLVHGLDGLDENVGGFAVFSWFVVGLAVGVDDFNFWIFDFTEECNYSNVRLDFEFYNSDGNSGI